MSGVGATQVALVEPHNYMYLAYAEAFRVAPTPFHPIPPNKQLSETCDSKILQASTSIRQVSLHKQTSHNLAHCVAPTPVTILHTCRRCHTSILNVPVNALRHVHNACQLICIFFYTRQLHTHCVAPTPIPQPLPSASHKHW